MTLPLVKSQSLYDVSVCEMYYVRGMWDVRCKGMWYVQCKGMWDGISIMADYNLPLYSSIHEQSVDQ